MSFLLRACAYLCGQRRKLFVSFCFPPCLEPWHTSGREKRAFRRVLVVSSTSSKRTFARRGGGEIILCPLVVRTCSTCTNFVLQVPAHVTRGDDDDAFYMLERTHRGGLASAKSLTVHRLELGGFTFLENKIGRETKGSPLR